MPLISVVHVAVAVVLDENNRVLISLRGDHLHQGGLWEFPGGKVESGESVEAALDRELQEELNIGVQSCSSLIKIEHDYGDKRVLLDVWTVSEFTGKPVSLEGQPFKWVEINFLKEYRFPAANHAIIDLLIQNE